MSSRDHLIKVLETAAVVAGKRAWTEEEGFVYRLMKQRLLARLAWAIAYDLPTDRLAPEWYGAGAFLVAHVERGERATTVLIFSAEPDGDGPFDPGGGGVTCSEGVKRGMFLLRKDGRGWLMEQIDGEPIFDGDDNDLLDRLGDLDGIYLIQNANSNSSIIEGSIGSGRLRVSAADDKRHRSTGLSVPMIKHETTSMFAVNMASSTVFLGSFQVILLAIAGDRRQMTIHPITSETSFAPCTTTDLTTFNAAAPRMPASPPSEDPSGRSHPVYFGLGHAFGGERESMGGPNIRVWRPPLWH